MMIFDQTKCLARDIFLVVNINVAFGDKGRLIFFLVTQGQVIFTFFLDFIL